MGVFSQELASLYASASQQNPSYLPELPVQYADFAVWQREWLSGAVLDAELTYWKEQLKDAPPVLELPTDRPRPSVESFRGDVASVQLSKELTDRLNALSQAEGGTLFITLLAAFDALLSRYSGQDDIVVGTPIAGRNHAEIAGLIGFFANTLPLRLRPSADPTSPALPNRTKAVALTA